MDKLRDKLAKIKAIAQEAEGTDEGIAALLLYQRLLGQSGYEDEDIGERRQAVQELEVFSATRAPVWIQHLAGCIANHFRCVLVCKRYREHHTDLLMTGLPADAALAKETFAVALAVAKTNAARLSKAGVLRGRESHTSYHLGFVMGLDMAFCEQEASGTLAITSTIPDEVRAVVAGMQRVQKKIAPPDPLSYIKGRKDGREFLSNKRLEEMA